MTDFEVMAQCGVVVGARPLEVPDQRDEGIMEEHSGESLAPPAYVWGS